MKFKVRGEGVVLQGDASLTKSVISLKAMMRTIRLVGNDLYLELSYLAGDADGSNKVKN